MTVVIFLPFSHSIITGLGMLITRRKFQTFTSPQIYRNVKNCLKLTILFSVYMCIVVCKICPNILSGYELPVRHGPTSTVRWWKCCTRSDTGCRRYVQNVRPSTEPRWRGWRKCARKQRENNLYNSWKKVRWVASLIIVWIVDYRISSV